MCFHGPVNEIVLYWKYRYQKQVTNTSKSEREREKKKELFARVNKKTLHKWKEKNLWNREKKIRKDSLEKNKLFESKNKKKI